MDDHDTNYDSQSEGGTVGKVRAIAAGPRKDRFHVHFQVYGFTNIVSTSLDVRLDALLRFSSA